MKKLLLLPLLAIIFTSPSVFAIKKCKDANGKWHYGDTAVKECENSKITTLTDRGFIEDELEAPKTKEELATEKAEQDRIEAEKKAKIEAEEEKVRILSIYETEDDIDRQRDNQIQSVQSNIEVHKAYINSMNGRIERNQKKMGEVESAVVKKSLQNQIDKANKDIAAYKKKLVSLEADKNKVIKRFEKEKEIYRKLKQESLEKSQNQ